MPYFIDIPEDWLDMMIEPDPDNGRYHVISFLVHPENVELIQEHGGVVTNDNKFSNLEKAQVAFETAEAAALFKLTYM